jgi:hypothetical protein
MATYLYWLDYDDVFLTIGVHDMYVRGMAIMDMQWIWHV